MISNNPSPETLKSVSPEVSFLAQRREAVIDHACGMLDNAVTTIGVFTPDYLKNDASINENIASSNLADNVSADSADTPAMITNKIAEALREGEAAALKRQEANTAATVNSMADYRAAVAEVYDVKKAA